MTFKKIALVTAIACVPMSAFAVESLDDSEMSAATGQDGLTISLDLAVATDTLIHDTDGITGITGVVSYTNAGAIVIDNMRIGADGIVVTIDAGDTGTSSTAPMLNVNVDLANGITIVTGTIGVANSRRDDGAWGSDGAVTNFVNTMTIVLGSTQLNVQLGAEQQGTHASTGAPLNIADDLSTAMIQIQATITGGLQLGSMGINDANSGGTIGSTLTTLANAGAGVGGNLDMDVEINVTTAGLEVYIYQLGTLANGMDVFIENQYLGTSAGGTIGDIEMQSLNLRGTAITITGNGNP